MKTKCYLSLELYIVKSACVTYFCNQSLFVGECFNSREIPQELVREARGKEINLNMEDHRANEYVKPKTSVKAFSGEGHMLGR